MKPGPVGQRGFSIFEAAFAVLVVGFILVVLLNRLGLFEYVMARTLVTEMQAVEQMVLAYQDRYGTVPGDDTMAASRFTGATSASSTYAGDGVIQGPDWVGDSTGSPAPADEPSLFWQHVRMAGLAEGDRAKFNAFNSAGGQLGIASSSVLNMPKAPSGSRSGFHVCSSRIDGHVARMMDADIDDSNATTGRMWAAAESSGAAVVDDRGTSHYDDEKTYTVCMLF